MAAFLNGRIGGCTLKRNGPEPAPEHAVASQTDRIRITGTVFLDVFVIAVSYLLAPAIRDLVDPLVRGIAGDWSYNPAEYNLFLIPVVVCTLLSLWGTGCYDKDYTRTTSAAAPRVLGALVLAQLALTFLAFYIKADFMSRGVMLTFFNLNLVGLLAVRLIVAVMSKKAMSHRTIIVGTNERAVELAEVLTREESHVIVGFLDVGGLKVVPEDRILGQVADTAEILHDRSPVDEVALSVRDPGKAEEAVDAAEERGIAVRQLLLPLASELHKVHFEHVGGLNMLTMKMSAASGMALFIKRVMDVAGSLVGLAIAAIVFPFVAIAIKLDSKGPVLYSQKRVGLNGRVFKIYKYRTMVVDAHSMREELAHLNEMDGPRFKIEKDPRVTRVGRVLRRFSIDELPQFYSVFKGDMSLVGPRPFPIEEVMAYERYQHRRLGMKPGLTGPWQIGGRCDLKTFDEMFEMDEDYIQHWSLWLDVTILLKTIPSVLFGKGAM